jgi:hypothetical protein
MIHRFLERFKKRRRAAAQRTYSQTGRKVGEV